jgi:hypothetical protein
MNHVECLQHGLANGLHKREGRLWKILLVDGVVPNTQEAKRERCYSAYQSQKVFIMAQKQLMPEGWDPRDPMQSVKKSKASGQFMSLQKDKNPVPVNVLTQSFLRYAYGVSKETMRRWLGEGPEYQTRVPHNKNKNVIDDVAMVKIYYSPKKLFMQHEMKEYAETPQGKTATPQERKKQREYLKAQYKVLPDDIMEIYKKASRDKLAMHGFVEEAIVDTLNDNNEQTFRALEKVCLLNASACVLNDLLIFVPTNLNHLLACQRLVFFQNN